MARIIFIPQYPTRMRYQEWWFWKFPEEFRKMGYEVLVIGENYSEMESLRGDLEMFSPINMAIEFETKQIREYMTLDLRKDDILFLADISFPGIFSNALFHKRCSKMFAFCHATSINRFDYFQNVRSIKFPVETAHSKLFNKVFLGSEYHWEKLQWYGNTIVTYLPFPPFKPSYIKEKSFDIMSASRPNKQKVDLDLETAVEETLGKIRRTVSYSWEGYYNNLAMSKILLITSHEDTFGYQIVDAIMNGCIPIARNSLAYPELLPREYLYDDKTELLQRIDYILNSGDDVPVPKLLCEEQMKNFYKEIDNIMRSN